MIKFSFKYWLIIIFAIASFVSNGESIFAKFETEKQFNLANSNPDCKITNIGVVQENFEHKR